MQLLQLIVENLQLLYVNDISTKFWKHSYESSSKNRFVKNAKTCFIHLSTTVFVSADRLWSRMSADYKAKRTWPPTFSDLSPKHQFQLEKRYRRRTVLKYARPTWMKWTKIAQWSAISCQCCSIDRLTTITNSDMI